MSTCRKQAPLDPKRRDGPGHQTPLGHRGAETQNYLQRAQLERRHRPPPRISQPLPSHGPTRSLCRSPAVSPAHRDSAAGPGSPPPVSPGSHQSLHERRGTVPALIGSLGPHFPAQRLLEETEALCAPRPWQHPAPHAGAGCWDGGWTPLHGRPCEAERSFEMGDMAAGRQGRATLALQGPRRPRETS